MDITMVGIDYTDAGLDIRGKFSYTKREQEETIAVLRKKEFQAAFCYPPVTGRSLYCRGQRNGSVRKGHFSVN